MQKSLLYESDIVQVLLRLVLMGGLINSVSEGSQWKCPEFNDTKISCLCDFPQTLRCCTDLILLKQIRNKLLTLTNPDESVSLLDCTLRNVTHLSEPILQGVPLHGLVLTSGELKNVSKRAFSQLSGSVQALGLPNNKLETVPGEALKVLKQLERLDLSYNKLSDINFQSFVNLINLKYLDLSNNRIVNISFDAFSQMKNLTVIKLNKNRLMISTISALTKINKLEELDLSTNELSGPLESETLPNMPALKTLSLANNQFSSINQGAIKGVPNLVSLSLSHNQIDVLEDHAFKELSSLRSLYLGSNRIVAISSSSLAHLNQLAELDLSHNFLRAMTPDIISPLNNLRVLRLDDNDISMVEPDTFRQNTSLEHLTLSDNPLNCDCNLVDFSIWLNNVSKLSVADKNTAICMTPLHLENALVVEIPTKELRCEEDDYDLLMQEGPSAAHVSESKIILRAFNFNGFNITLLWSIDTKAKSFSCDALFVYEEMSSHEILLMSTPLKCNSSQMADPTTLIVRLNLGSMQPFHRYRFCIVLLEDNKFTDEMQLVLGCSEIIPLIATNHSIPQSSNPSLPVKISSLRANISQDKLFVSVEIWNPKKIIDNKCQVTLTVFSMGSLVAQHSLNCTNPKISMSGLSSGNYHVCASLDHVSPPERLQCVTVKNQIKSETTTTTTTLWITLCLILMSTLGFIVFYFVYRKIIRKSRIKTAHQCFLGSNDFDDHQKQHSKYIKLQTSINI
ncbi:leucine-rich transmembrane protein, putative [Pediculus humanus corporis]|uniref:Leucine-rich transmembrane protein, putative n=1 Tax=Pediculus humanus subsp. corporis TaxID=121224 RepID=E0VS99_PEDHC|nr:leucine-rich transmembrane protein, putative [Pediculus humanus corporis]EEB16255.1 leucine-rich transmembrane protein, putative [Pediculus humanus corporis]